MLDHEEFPLTVKLSGCSAAPHQWDSSVVPCMYSDTVTVFRGAVMIHVNNNMLLVRVSADVLKA